MIRCRDNGTARRLSSNKIAVSMAVRLSVAVFVRLRYQNWDLFGNCLPI